MTWIQGYRSADGSVELNHLDGVEWFNAPLPSRWHQCKPQTSGYTGWFNKVERCACGAIRLDGRSWMERNARWTVAQRNSTTEGEKEL